MKGVRLHNNLNLTGRQFGTNRVPRSPSEIGKIFSFLAESLDYGSDVLEQFQVILNQNEGAPKSIFQCAFISQRPSVFIAAMKIFGFNLGFRNFIHAFLNDLSLELEVQQQLISVLVQELLAQF